MDTFTRLPCESTDAIVFGERTAWPYLEEGDALDL